MSSFGTAVTILGSTVWLVSSLAHIGITLRSDRGAIRLPDTDDQHEGTSPYPNDPTNRIPVEQVDDQLDVDELEAIAHVKEGIDGRPVDLDAYRRTVRRSRLILCLTAALVLALLAIQLAVRSPLAGRRHGHSGAPSPITWSDALRDPQCRPLLAGLLLWINALYFAMQSMRGSTYWTAVVQIATLSITSFITCVGLLVVPDAIDDRQYPFYLVLLVFSALELWVAINVPSGPRWVKQTPHGSVPMARLSHKGCTILSRLWYTSSFSLVWTARRKGSLDEADVPLMGSDFDTHRLFCDFRHYFDKYTQGEPPSYDKTKSFSTIHACWPIMRALFSSNRSLFLTHEALAIVAGMTWYVPAYVSFRIVRFLEEAEQVDGGASGQRRLRFGFQYCLLMISTLMVQTMLVSRIWTIQIAWLRNRIRAQLQMAIFAKALRRKDISKVEELDTKADGEEGQGKAKKEATGDGIQTFSKNQIINLISTDTERCSNVIFLFVLTQSPVEIATGGFFAAYLLGWGAVVGLLSTLFIQPIIFLIGKWLARLQEALQEVRDRKTSVLNELVQAIKMIKFNAWEVKASSRIHRLRDEEIGAQRRLFLVDLIQMLLFEFSPSLVVIVSYAWFVFVDHVSLTPSVAFTALSVLDEMRYSLTYFPECISEVIQTLVSLRRIQHYLASEEVAPVRPTSTPMTHRDLAIEHATIQWPAVRSKTTVESTRSVFALHDIDIIFVPEALNLITGRLGSGKTLLLNGLLGEADIVAGQVTCPRSLPYSIHPGLRLNAANWLAVDQLAYVPQSAFLVNASLRDNVLFGLPLLEDRYNATLDAAGLRPDLKLLEDGDLTEIGENGIGLSGGQAIRVMLARAVYGRAATLILDDPLSAVDAHTALHIHQELLRGPLCQGRTVVLVTHQVQLVAQTAAQVIMLRNGRLAFVGDAATFVNSDLYSGLVEEEEQQQIKPEAMSSESVATSPTNTPATTAPPSPQLGPSKVIEPQQGVEAESNVNKTPRKLVEEEKRAKGGVLLSIYGRYIHACGGWLFAVTLLMAFVSAKGMKAVTTQWLKRWTDDVTHGLLHSDQRQHDDLWWITLWSGLLLAEVVLNVTKMLVLVLGSLRASRVLYRSMLKAVLHAPMRFHDTVSRGRLLNRFGYDFEEMDSEVPYVFVRVGDELLMIIISMSAIATGGGVQFVLFFVLCIPFYAFVGRIYMNAMRDLKRLASTTRSPVLNTFGDVIRGTVVLRAFGAGDHFYRTLVDRINVNAVYGVWISEVRWWYEVVFNSISFSVLLVAMVVILRNESITASQAGFIFSFLINAHTHILFFLRSLTDMEQKLVSVERIVEYTGLEGEPSIENETDSSPIAPATITPNWPTEGQVAVRDLRVRYAVDLPEVLHGISFTVPPRSKVGIVGPTGCGKSTLASAFFRFVQRSSGAIEVDGIDLGSVDLATLRARLQIVPQDPVIFSGPIRASLDVFDEYTDEEVLEALRKVQLIQPSAPLAAATSASATAPSASNVAHPGSRRDFSDLTFAVAEGGSNLSNGEKQLLCLARAILRNCRLIIFDEATSSVDFDTDALISHTIRQAFDASTVVTIAHRLRTIIDYDLVLVLDKGTVAEFAPPSQLLRDPTSRFYKLCRATGKRELAHLKQAAGLEA